MAEIKYPYLAYSELTGCVYIVLNKNKKVDVTSQYEFIVKNKSAADVVKVKHGKWKKKKDNYDCEYIECSCCGGVFYDGENDTYDLPPNYCCECGAKMDGVKNG